MPQSLMRDPHVACQTIGFGEAWFDGSCFYVFCQINFVTWQGFALTHIRLARPCRTIEALVGHLASVLPSVNGGSPVGLGRMHRWPMDATRAANESARCRFGKRWYLYSPQWIVPLWLDAANLWNFSFAGPGHVMYVPCL